jgi:hypothetical protein
MTSKVVPYSQPDPRSPYPKGKEFGFQDANIRWRIRCYKRFIVHDLSNALDIGGPNTVALNLGITNFTEESDLNKFVLANGVHPVITCFEVLEHVMNPAMLLWSLRQYLKRDGTLYLSTPVEPPIAWHQGHSHFTEYKTRAITTLLEYTGFRIERRTIYTVFPPWFMFTGVRPLFRYAFYRMQVYEATNAAYSRSGL